MIARIAAASLLALTLPATAAHAQLRGTISIDGSSTVYPITEGVAEEFSKKNAQVKVTVGISGTGGGFKRFTKGETDISDASAWVWLRCEYAPRMSLVPSGTVKPAM